MKNITINWKTTIAGVLALAVVGYSVYQNPALLTDPATLAKVATAIGLIVAKDGDKTGTGKVQTEQTDAATGSN